jgi:hypothetical protein
MNARMTNFFAVLVGAAVFGRLAVYGLPWWGVAVGAALAGLMLARKGWIAFAGGLAGIGLLWGAYAAAAASAEGQVLAERLAALTGAGSPGALVGAVALVGGLLGGLAAWTGWQLRRVVVE